MSALVSTRGRYLSSRSDGKKFAMLVPLPAAVSPTAISGLPGVSGHGIFLSYRGGLQPVSGLTGPAPVAAATDFAAEATLWLTITNITGRATAITAAPLPSASL
jgi:hypothetical protein